MHFLNFDLEVQQEVQLEQMGDHLFHIFGKAISGSLMAKLDLQPKIYNLSDWRVS